MEANNMKAMREAVDGIKNTANSALTALSIGNDTSSFLWDIIRKCESALAKPPRNCDMGTVKEQEERWFRFCQQNQNPFSSDTCLTCDARANARECGCEICGFSWAQMPYEEGGAE